MNVSEFDYRLPEELIAQYPLEDRASSRMLVLHRNEQRLEDRTFRDLPEYLGAGDCLVINNSRVLPARLFGKRPGYDGDIEVLLTRCLDPQQNHWLALVRPGRKIHTGGEIQFSEHLRARVLAEGEMGERTLVLEADVPFYAELDRVGHMPLPPYMKRHDEPADRERYQTVYGSQPGSAAAPTAGLHFTPEVMQACRGRGAEFAEVTLHVGLGTFQPLRTDVVEEVQLHSEFYSLPARTADLLNAAARRIAVGTTSVRTLETIASTGPLREAEGDTQLFIYPGFQFRAVDAMITNFHLPQSSLLMLVSAFAGKEFTLAAYNHAVSNHYRFFSYGDCMLIL